MSMSVNNKENSQHGMDMLEIRIARAQDAATPPYVLKELSKDPSWLVRQHVASNSGTPEGCLWELTYDPDSRVRDEAFNTLDFLGLRFPAHKAPLSASKVPEKK